MDHLNGKTELLKQIHILKDHLNRKTELLKQTHIQMDFPFQWNGMVETNGGKIVPLINFHKLIIIKNMLSDFQNLKLKKLLFYLFL